MIPNGSNVPVCLRKTRPCRRQNSALSIHSTLVPFCPSLSSTSSSSSSPSSSSSWVRSRRRSFVSSLGRWSFVVRLVSRRLSLLSSSSSCPFVVFVYLLVAMIRNGSSRRHRRRPRSSSSSSSSLSPSSSSSLSPSFLVFARGRRRRRLLGAFACALLVSSAKNEQGREVLACRDSGFHGSDLIYWQLVSRIRH